MVDFLNFLSNNVVWIILSILIIFVVMGLFIANFSSDNYLNGLKKYKDIFTKYDGNALDFANFLSRKYFSGYINVQITPTDKYSANASYTPSQSLVKISSDLAFDNSIASIATISHEFGHASQHFSNNKILIKNYRFLKFVKILGMVNAFLFALIIVGIIINNVTLIFITLGFVFINFILAIFLKLSTLKLEKNASIRALEIIKKTNLFSNKEQMQMKKFLKLAQKTYTADLFKALLAWTGLTGKTKYF